MFIIYNQDGSIKKTNFAEFIQRGNDGSNRIFVCIDGENIQNYTTYALFKLPDGEIGGPINGVQATRTIEGKSYTGYNIPITSAVTMFEGIVHMTLYVANPTTQAVLYTYPVVLTINDTNVTPPDLTQINLEQYQQLLNIITQSGYNFIELKGTSGTLTDDEYDIIKSAQTIIKRDDYFYKLAVDFAAYYEYYCFTGHNETNVMVFGMGRIIITKSNKSWRYFGEGGRFYKEAKVDELLGEKQNTLTWDNTPTENSLNPVRSGGIYSAIQAAVTGATHFIDTVADLTELAAVQDPATGDMYWVTSEDCYYIWNGSAWKPAGGNVDLSNYVAKNSGTRANPEIISGVKAFTSELLLSETVGGCYLYYSYGSLGVYIGGPVKLQIGETKTYTNNHIIPGGANRPTDLGENSTYGYFRDLYLYGSLKDRTNNISIKEIVGKANVRTIQGNVPTNDIAAQRLIKFDTGENFANLADFNSYVSGRSFQNDAFKTQSARLEFNYTDIGSSYLILEDLYVAKLGNLKTKSKIGDIFIYAGTYPARYVVYNGPTDIHFVSIRAKEQDLSNYVTTNTDQPITGTKTFYETKYAGFATGYGTIRNVSPLAASVGIFLKSTLDDSTMAALELWNGAAQIVGNLVPDSTANNRDLGTALSKWHDLYISNEIKVGSWTVKEDSGSLLITDGTNAVLRLLQYQVGEGAIIYNRLSPANENTLDLGSYGNAWGNHRWRDIYLSGNISDGAHSCTVAEIYAKVHETVSRSGLYYHAFTVTFSDSTPTAYIKFISTKSTQYNASDFSATNSDRVSLFTLMKNIVNVEVDGVYGAKVGTDYNGTKYSIKLSGIKSDLSGTQSINLLNADTITYTETLTPLGE